MVWLAWYESEELDGVFESPEAFEQWATGYYEKAKVFKKQIHTDGKEISYIFEQYDEYFNVLLEAENVIKEV